MTSRNSSLRTPSYRLHKPTGQAVVTLDGKDIYLGRHGTPQSRAEYDRLIAEWLANGRRLPSGADLTVNELLPASVHHGLQAVPGLKAGRTGARESDPVEPVSDTQSHDIAD